MQVQKYICPKCRYSKAPTTHSGCGGIVLKIANEWICNTCFRRISDRTVCAKCGAEFTGNLYEVDTQFY